MTAQTYLVELRDIYLTLGSAAGEVNILRGLDFVVERGESVSVVGPSGAGKSTMMMVMAGLERPTSGTVTVAGQGLNPLSEDALAQFRQRNVGIVFQAFRLIPTMNAEENVALPLELAGDRNAAEHARSALKAVGLEHRFTHYPEQLSGGEQQRVALARAYVVQPPLLLADEPTGNLDGDTGESVIELLFTLRDRAGSALVLITHDPKLAHRCDRVVTLRDGRIENSGDRFPRVVDA